MNREVLSKYDIMTVGETPDVPLEHALRYANNEGTELNMVFQFEQNTLDCGPERYSYRKVPLPELKACFSKWQTVLQDKAWNSLYWTNHDQPRTVSRRGNDGQYRKESQKMLYTMLLTMQGTPYIYQGEEIGMTNVHFDSIEDYNDIEVKISGKSVSLTAARTRRFCWMPSGSVPAIMQGLPCSGMTARMPDLPREHRG